MTSPAILLKSLVTAYATNVSYQVHIDSMPDGPDKCICLKDSGGFESNPKWLLDFPTVQILVRGPLGTYVATYAVAQGIRDTLLGVNSQDIGDDRLVSITELSNIASIGPDSKSRALFSMNFNLIIEPVASAETNREAL